ncbi:hypothetical protein BCR34DRAFT_69004 [Clohesyomyces aquaticus]|uniref:Uncharacterized protein n=1 Tax=Clohesyomyces aquaticus TaxID=1231657 RepID=A0A1Y1Z0E4_9PLEO|nr:hypothetical protein BCR34DRAFT_69004 [Clohesyomyces aquaticus]
MKHPNRSATTALSGAGCRQWQGFRRQLSNNAAGTAGESSKVIDLSSCGRHVRPARVNFFPFQACRGSPSIFVTAAPSQLSCTISNAAFRACRCHLLAATLSSYPRAGFDSVALRPPLIDT